MPGRRWRIEDAYGTAAGFGGTVCLHGFHIDAQLYCGTRCGMGIGEDSGKRFSGGDPKLRLHQVDPSDLLGDGMFDLQACIGFDEYEPAVRRVDEEFDGAGILVSGRGGQLHSRYVNLPGEPRVQAWCWCDLHDFLVATLQGAVPFSQMTGVARVIGKNLHFNMARVRYELFHIQFAATERRLGFTGTTCKCIVERGGIIDNMHAAAATACDRFDDHSIARWQCRQKLSRLIEAGGFGRAGRDGNLLCGCQAPCCTLVTEKGQRIGIRADECDAASVTLASEPGILAEKAIAGMNGVAVALFGRVDDRFHVEISGGTLAGEFDALVGAPGMQRVLVVGGIDRNAGNAEARRRAHDSDGDIAAVGDKESRDHDRTRMSDKPLL